MRLWHHGVEFLSVVLFRWLDVSGWRLYRARRRVRLSSSDIAATASRILLLHRGRLLYDGPATGLANLARGDTEPAGRLVEPNLEEAYLAVIGEESGTWGKEKSGEAGSLLDLSRWDSRVVRA